MSGGGTNTVSQTTIPSSILPYYQNALGQGAALQASGGPQYYPGQQVAPLNPLQEQGLTTAGQGVGMAQNAYGIAQAGVPMALQGYGNAQQAYQPSLQGLGQIQQTAAGPNASTGAQAANMFETGGALLNPAMNPYLQGTFQQGAQQVQNSLDSQFGAAGRNTLASAPVQSDEMNNLATQLYGGAYNQGLQTMTQASALAPSIDAGTYMPGQQLLNASGAALGNNAQVNNAGNNFLNAGVNLQGSGNNILNAGNNALQAGAGLQGQTQNQINAAMNQWNYNAQLPYNQLSWYSGLLGQNASPFRSSSGQTTGQANPWANVFGGALVGNSLYNSATAPSAAGALASTGLMSGAFDGTAATAGMLSEADLAALSAGVGDSAAAALASAAPYAIAAA
jgi:hypothetical protein